MCVCVCVCVCVRVCDIDESYSHIAVSSDVFQFTTHEDDTTVASTLTNVKDQVGQIQNNKL